jgi:hypothetical protein
MRSRQYLGLLVAAFLGGVTANLAASGFSTAQASGPQEVKVVGWKTTNNPHVIVHGPSTIEMGPNGALFDTTCDIVKEPGVTLHPVRVRVSK